MSYRVVHYINQFFANIGGEEMAHVAPELREGFVGPGMAFNQAWKGEAEIVKTIICGDSYYAEHERKPRLRSLIGSRPRSPTYSLPAPLSMPAVTVMPAPMWLWPSRKSWASRYSPVCT